MKFLPVVAEGRQRYVTTSKESTAAFC